MSFSRKDVDELKPAIERCVQRVIGSQNNAIVTVALSCLEKGYDKDRTRTKMSSLVNDSLALKFTDKLYSLYEDYINMVVHSEKKRKRKPSNEQTGERDENKKPKTEVDDVGKVPSTFGEFTADKIKEMMANAQRMIQERKTQLNLTTPSQLGAASGNQNLVADKMSRANELQARIQASLASSGISSTVGNLSNMTGLTHVILDEQGRTVDPLTGQPIQFQLHTPTLKANIRAKKREQFKAVQDKPPEEISHSSFFDHRLKPKLTTRNRKTFKFFEAGKFEKIGQRMRTKAQLEKLQNEVSLAARKTGIATAAKLAIIQPKRDSPDEVPSIEPWDEVIWTEMEEDALGSDDGPTSPSGDVKLPDEFQNISHLVEHPIQLKQIDRNKGISIPVMLTKKEAKKLRKQNRSEIQKEIQEKIRLGLEPPPEPKVRMANLMRVLGTEAVQNPTKVEAHVRAQMAKRQKAHEDSNAARKLTKEQRRDKKIKKLKEDTSAGVIASVYRVGELTDLSKKFKVEANANQLFMTGIVVLHKDCNIIVVEGGAKQQKKFRRLVMNRIKWEGKNRPDDEDNDDEENDDTKISGCKLVWEGLVKNRAFGEIKFKNCPTEAFAREQFRKHNVEHYWNFAFSSTILETTQATESFTETC